jgi:group I intron endonuclease
MQVYAINNIANGKIYVGQTIRDLDAYLRSDVTRALKRTKDRKPYLYAAIRKYGPKNFTIRCIHKCADKAEMDRAEKAYIKLFGTQDPELGYNLADGGGGSFGYTRVITSEHREKIRLAGIGRKHSEDTKARMRAAAVGKPKSEEHKAKLRKPKSDEAKAAMKAAWTLERKAKGTSFSKGRVITEAIREKIRQANIAYQVRKRQEAECRLNPMALPAAA